MDPYNQPQPPMPNQPQMPSPHMPQAPQPQIPASQPQMPNHNQYYDQVKPASKDKLNMISFIASLVVLIISLNIFPLLMTMIRTKKSFIVVFVVIFGIIALANLALNIICLKKSKQTEDSNKSLIFAAFIISAFAIVNAILIIILALTKVFSSYGF